MWVKARVREYVTPNAKLINQDGKLDKTGRGLVWQ